VKKLKFLPLDFLFKDVFFLFRHRECHPLGWELDVIRSSSYFHWY